MLATYAAMAAAIVAGAGSPAPAGSTRRPPPVAQSDRPPSPTAGLGRGIAAIGERAGGVPLTALGRRRRRARRRSRASSLRPHGRGARGPAVHPGLRIEVLDVGQGDAILLQPRSAPAVLVDGGPPGDEIVAKLRGEGVERLGAAVVTHDQSDHAAGIAEALGRDADRPPRLRAPRPRASSPPPRPTAPVPTRSPPAPRSAPARSASKSSGRRPTSSPKPLPTPTRTSWRSSSAPAGTTSRCCSPPTPRRNRRRSTPARSTSSRSPTTAATTPASGRSSTASVPASR